MYIRLALCLIYIWYENLLQGATKNFNVGCEAYYM
jgi:hypothetical protein